jgi:hypothetical protein
MNEKKKKKKKGLRADEKLFFMWKEIKFICLFFAD